ncbi:MAG TPA: Ig-like domain-containing protein [Anaeromyxobacter sp.]
MTIRALSLALLALAGCGGPSRVELSPTSLRFGIRGQTAKVHAAPYAKSGKSVPDQICKWSSSDPKVATVAGPANDVVVTAAGPGSANVTCAIGDVSAELSVLVRVVAKIEVAPAQVELKMLDDPQPVPLQISATDDTGAQVVGRAMLSRCASEDVCRGDGRGQLWAAGPGDTTAWVEIEGAKSAELKVHVVDKRTAEGKPKAVKGNPMDEIEKMYLKKVADEKKAAEKAAGRK